MCTKVTIFTSLVTCCLKRILYCFLCCRVLVQLYFNETSPGFTVALFNQSFWDGFRSRPNNLVRDFRDNLRWPAIALDYEIIRGGPSTNVHPRRTADDDNRVQDDPTLNAVLLRSWPDGKGLCAQETNTTGLLFNPTNLHFCFVVVLLLLLLLFVCLFFVRKTNRSTKSSMTLLCACMNILPAIKAGMYNRGNHIGGCDYFL